MRDFRRSRCGCAPRAARRPNSLSPSRTALPRVASASLAARLPLHLAQWWPSVKVTYTSMRMLSGADGAASAPACATRGDDSSRAFAHRRPPAASADGGGPECAFALLRLHAANGKTSTVHAERDALVSRDSRSDADVRPHPLAQTTALRSRRRGRQGGFARIINIIGKEDLISFP